MKVMERSMTMKYLTPKKLFILLELILIIGIVTYSMVKTYRAIDNDYKQDTFQKREYFNQEDADNAILINHIEAYEKITDYDKALINTYLKQIELASHDFYGEYYTVLPTISYYYVRVIKVQSNQVLNPTIYITFRVSPYLGPHNVIGEDEVTFSANYMGEVGLVEFQHLATYDLPENMKDLVKKKVPVAE